MEECLFIHSYTNSIQKLKKTQISLKKTTYINWITSRIILIKRLHKSESSVINQKILN